MAMTVRAGMLSVFC